MSDNLHEMKRRIYLLENQNQMMKGLLLMVSVLAGAALLMGQARGPAASVDAREFVVRDETGNVRAVLGLDEAGAARLAFYDPGEEVESAWLGVADGDPLLALMDVGGSFRASLGGGVFYQQGLQGAFLLDLESPGTTTGLTLRDSDGEDRVRAAIAGAGTGFTLHDGSGGVRLSAGVDAEGVSSLALPVAPGQPGLRLYAREDGVGILANDPQGRLRFGLDVPAEGEMDLGMFDRGGATVFSAPRAR